MANSSKYSSSYQALNPTHFAITYSNFLCIGADIQADSGASHVHPGGSARADATADDADADVDVDDEHDERREQ